MPGLVDIKLEVFLEDSKLEKLYDEYDERVQEAVDETADEATLDTIQNIEEQKLVLSGFLRDSVSNVKGGKWERHVVVGAWYAGPHEFGTHGQRARPFIRPAIMSAKKPFIERIRGVFDI